MIQEQDRAWASRILKKCEDKYAWVAKKHQKGIPATTGPDGRYDNRADTSIDWPPDNGLNWWTNGFWAGILWHLYRDTGDDFYAQTARTSERLMDRCFEELYGLHHDVGFMWIPTSVFNYTLTGDTAARRRALHAANLLAGRFNPVGRFIRAWNDIPGEDSDTRGWAIIDSLLNIPLLHWASQETGDPRYSHVANAHADTLLATFIRKDGSVNHIVEYDPQKGGVVRTYGGQGYENGSAWTRGQAWALYGFATNHRLTGKAEYGKAAQKVAEYFGAHIPQSGLIPVDFDQPAQPTLEDSCGAAIAACGFIELALQAKGNEGDKYLKHALHLLRALDENRSDYGESCDAILTHCTAAYHSLESRHITMVYADYFYLRALHKLVHGNTAFIW